MEKAETRALLLKSLHNEVFTNPDLIEIIKSNIDCETLTDFCLTSKNWCKKVFENNELRLEVARCAMTRINDNLRTLYDMLLNDIDNYSIWWEWTNEPGSPLFIEFGDDYFAVCIQLTLNTAEMFLQQNPNFKEISRNTAELLGLIFNVNVTEESIDKDNRDPYYTNFNFGFNQNIPRDIRLKLPFSDVVLDHDNQISLSSIDDFDVEAFPFDELLNWTRVRRSQRLNPRAQRSARLL